MRSQNQLAKVALLSILMISTGYSDRSSPTKAIVFQTFPDDADVLIDSRQKSGDKASFKGKSGKPCSIARSEFITNQTEDTVGPRTFIFHKVGHVDATIEIQWSNLTDGQPYPVTAPIQLEPENIFYRMLDHWIFVSAVSSLVAAAIGIFALKAKRSRQQERQAQEQAELNRLQAQAAQLQAQQEEEARHLAEAQRAKAEIERMQAEKAAIEAAALQAIAEEEQRKLLQEKQIHLDQIHAIESLFNCKLPAGKTGFDKLGKYFKAKRLGVGGYGEVWACCDSENITPQGRVAIKILLAEHNKTSEFIMRFKREARVTRNINHPNLVKVIDYEIDTDLYLVMEYIEGTSLHELVEQAPALPIPRRQALNIFYQACLGVEALHQNNICHRDLKPHNIMIEDSGRAVIIDLGNARHREDQGNSHFNTVIDSEGIRPTIGTAGYSPPEAYNKTENEFVASPKMDQYTMGIILTQLITGKTVVQGLALVLAGRIDDIAEVSDLPNAFISSAKRMTSLDPNARFPSLTEARLALQAALPGISDMNV